MLAWLPGPLDRASAHWLLRRGLATDAYRVYVESGRPRLIPGGPFAGMVYLGAGAGSALYPKVFGTYELELAPIIEESLAAEPDLMINIGAAEGYYAVGYALRRPGLRVLAFEADPYARKLLKRLARLNNAIIEPRGPCDAKALNAALKPARAPLVVCDCEGCENAVLDPTRAPELLGARVLVELHDCFFPGTEKRLRDRFAASHRLRRIAARPRIAAEEPANLSTDDAQAVMNEGRAPGQAWLYLEPIDQLSSTVSVPSSSPSS